MPEIIESPHIKGVYTVQLKAFGDERGRFTETFRKEWFPQRSWQNVQMNCSESIGGVVRGLHYHFKQVDYWCVMKGHIRAALFDLRPNSPTFKQAQTIDMTAEQRTGLFIPVGVAHGFAGLSEHLILTYVVDNYYDSSDEFGVKWDDPALGLDWGLEWPIEETIVSGRDAANPLLNEIPLDRLPRL